MMFICNFCTDYFEDFLTYKRHLKSQHYEEKRVKITKINLEKERISCVNSCNWLEDSKEHILFNIDGNKFCVDCKGDRIGHFRMEKAFKGYMEKIRDLNDIFHPELWVPVKRHTLTAAGVKKPEMVMKKVEHFTNLQIIQSMFSVTDVSDKYGN